MFVVPFLIDVTIRILVNPRLAPSLILGQWTVRRQQPEYVGAAQKRFAWAIGFALALVMLYVIVIGHVIANDPNARRATPASAIAPAPIDPAEAERCKVPDFAKAIGHQDKWKLHNNCR